eukprot:scaffold10399_cov94-Isochrysis_galbana.AAC.4
MGRCRLPPPFCQKTFDFLAFLHPPHRSSRHSVSKRRSTCAGAGPPRGTHPRTRATVGHREKCAMSWQGRHRVRYFF